MKKLNILNASLILGLVIAITSINTSCKKDRIEPPENEYEDINQYLDTKKQEEQEFVITGPGNDTITGNQGTKIIGGKNCLQDANGDTIDYPFSIHLVELYTPKDMMYWQIPTVSNGNVLETDGEIRIRVTKNGQELSLSCPYEFWMPNSAPNSNMTIFKGSVGASVNWINTTTPFTLINYGYSGITSSLGWLGADIQRGTGTGHSLTFASQVDNLSNVGIFIYIPLYQTVMQVTNLTSGLIPNGLDVKIVMMAQDASGQLFSYTESRNVTGSTTIVMSLSPTTDAALTAHLDGL